MTDQKTAEPQAAAEELSGRIFTAGVAAAELYGVYLGLSLGLYRALADTPDITAADLADSTGLDRRYTREWLQGQAVSGFVRASGPDMATATFDLPEGGREVLVDEVSPYYLAALSRLPAALGRALPQLVSAFRTGAGVPLPEYGPDAVAGQAALNRPAYHNELADWIATMPDVAARLTDTARPARIADLGCGTGWAAIALATHFPVTVDGFDVDSATVGEARLNVASHGLTDRITIAVQDLTEPPPAAGYDLVMFLECLHDMAFPDRALRTARSMLADGGSVFVMEEAAEDALTAPNDDPVQRFLANVGPLWCIPQGRTAPDADPVGPVIRAARLTDLATAAGFRRTEILPVENPVFRFYRLHP
ncbi:SAM-dependent methyltransferase [Actinocatenispora rupis]|uniref:SAM-dependent methyltransferase n=1 Tax=Actinocatenispora rupis TaxID=519421 RepID=A0A8J3J5Q0_9ACTN|nr:class I SAM-dependent methyltransferase [Actinocatenispora rupis]GID14633.1 SAM-dependent methyltransferase [Actinocatenispora rupis]